MKALKKLGWAVLLVALVYGATWLLHQAALRNSPQAFAPVSAASTQ